MAWRAAKFPLLRLAIIAYYEVGPIGARASWTRNHPFDREHRIRASRALPGYLLRPSDPFDAYTTAYCPAQPSIIRAAIGAIPDPQNCHFLDIGCGKGRPLVIATEFCFPAITGVELSPTLAWFARRNAAACARLHPKRTRIDIVCGDALDYKLPQDKLVLFLYNPFGQPLIAQLLANIEASLADSRRELYIIYYNPVWAEVFDQSASLERRFAAQVPYASAELGYGPDESDAVVIWQNRGNQHPRPPGNVFGQVKIVAPGVRAVIVEPLEAEFHRPQLRVNSSLGVLPDG